MSVVAPRAPRGVRALLATALVAVGTCTSLGAVAAMLGTGGWRGATWGSVLVVAGVVAATRAATRTWWLPSAVGLVAAALLVVLRYGAPPGRLQLVPDGDTVDRARAAWSDGLAYIDHAVAPMDVTKPSEMVLVVAALGVLLVADLLAVGLGRPAWAGLAFLLMWLPGLYLGIGSGVAALLWTGITFLLLLALVSAPAVQGDDERSRWTTTSLVASVAVVVGALVLGPVLAALPGWSDLRIPSFGSGAAGPLRLSDQLDLRHSLGARSGQTVLTYTVRPYPADDAVTPADQEPGPDLPNPTATDAVSVGAGSLGPLRAFTLTQFDGRTWTPTDPSASSPVSSTTLLSPVAALQGQEPSADRGTLAQVDVNVGTLDETRLPIGIFARTVAARGQWEYDAAQDEVFGSSPTRGGDSYSMVVEIPSLTPDDLAAAQAPAPADAATTGVLEVPATSHSDDIAALAKKITADATSPYAQAMDLQSYLRSTANFTYDTRVAPARTDDAVWDFLQDRHGYCVQFATSMTIMARTLGIPARVGIGFLPGSTDGDGTYTVTGKQAHAWPELYFGDDLGWVRFEPTPAVQSGPPPVWSDPFRASQAIDNPDIPHGATAAPTQDSSTSAPGDDETSAPTTTVTTSSTGWLAPVGITLAVVLVLAALALSAVVRVRRRRAEQVTAERAWGRLRRRLAADGVRWSDATTPRDATRTICRQVEERSGHTLPDSALTALTGLSRAVEQQRYAPSPTDVSAGQLSAWVDEAAGAVHDAVGGRSRRGARDGRTAATSTR
ncbi:DUF3488 and transglutaminase-like domain-containing protein [Cellulomonas sp. HZM]|uniref:transglutaminase family protein n=1 Tax=Cellulomonas sp. HZM TaxID=1454010 RepID=UPI0012DE7A23|nr:DUF3488 and transglutaminase-like domain-containing protein [Cellulomonas sp. HZM]